MDCSPRNLLLDISFYSDYRFFDFMMLTFQNHTPGEPYDCGLASAPCYSSIIQGFTDNTTGYWFDTIIVYTLMPILTLICLFGNICNIIIFSKYSITSGSTNTLLLAVSAVDVLSNLNNTAILTSMFLCFVDTSMALTSYNLLIGSTYRNSIWFSVLGLDIVAVLSMQRATAVVFPFHVSKIFSHRNTNIILIVLFAFTILTMIPNYYGFVAKWDLHPYFNKYISLGHEFRYDYRIFYMYCDYYLTYRSILDIAILTVCVSVTIYKLRQQSKTRSGLSASEPKTDGESNTPKMSIREMKMVKMSLVVCIMTVVLYSIPTALVQAYTIQAKNDMMPDVGTSVINCVGQVFSYLISGFNFFLYLAMSEQYREKFVSIFIPFKK